MVDFIRDRPEYAGYEAKYIYYLPLFPNIADQSNIFTIIPEGWAPDKEPASWQPGLRENFIVYYIEVDVPLLSVKDVRATITADGVSTTYNRFDDPDVIRLSVVKGFNIGYDYPKNEDGSPQTSLTPDYNVAEFRFNEFPADSTEYLFEVIDEYGEVVISEAGTINMVEPPPFVQP